MLCPIEQARLDYKNKPSSLLGWIVAASYLYYHHHFNLFTDEEFDSMCKAAIPLYEQGIFDKHPLKHLVLLDDLKAGSLYALKEKDLTHTHKWMLLKMMKEGYDAL